MKQRPYILPEGYISGFEEKAREIPAAYYARRHGSVLIKSVYAFAAVACLVLVMGAGLYFKSSTRSDTVGDVMELSYEQLASADIIPDFWEYAEDDEDPASDDDTTLFIK